MLRHTLRSASVFALVSLAMAVAAPARAAVNDDPYGYGTVPLPPPLPAFQAQQASAVSYAPQTVYVPQMAGSYLPATRPMAMQPSTPMNAVQVGYVQAGQLPQQAMQPVYSAQPAPQPVYAQPQMMQPASQPLTQPAVQPSPAQSGYAYAPSAPAQQPTGSYAQQAGNSYSTPNWGDSSNSYAATSAYPQVASAAASAPAYASQGYTAQASSQGYASQGYAAQAYAAPVQQQPVQTQVQVQPPVDMTTATYSSYAQPQVQSQVQQPQVQTYPYAQQAYATQAVQQPQTAYAQQDSSQPYATQTYASGNYGPYTSAQSQPQVEEPTPSLSSEPGNKRWYFALRSGLSVPQDTTFKRSGATWTDEFKPGWEVDGAVGYDFNSWNSWLAPRAELELSYGEQSIDANKVNGTETKDPNAFGDVRSFDMLANGYLDFRVNRFFQPYVGVGFGFGLSDFDRIGNAATGPVMDDYDVGFVWQAGGGLSFNLTNLNSIDVGYRYRQNTGVNLKARDGTTTTVDQGNHTFLLGWRGNF